ncbi:Uncharacterized conserved protein [Ceraceosorus bombacis]|uniref:COX assembly mitochondrial protein n=1 Tax=Ceraceosorus bombacis TaxID=401625 RepID=A0A0P1B8P4_9BASI|nr:Uncharacterized conserved protein [Ceraceosorus bombacis]
MSHETQAQMFDSMSHALSNRESDALLKSAKAEGLKKCDDVLRAFAECSSGRTISMAWACRDHHKALRSCLAEYTSEEAMTKRRKEYLSSNRSKSGDRMV